MTIQEFADFINTTVHDAYATWAEAVRKEKEAAEAVRDWAFRNTAYPALYSYCQKTNLASRRTAEAIGMRFHREFADETNGVTWVSIIRREES